MSGAIFAVILGISAIAAALLSARAPGAARFFLRFSCALLLALALAYLLAAISAPRFALPASAIALLVSAVTPIALALAMLGAFSRAPSRLAAMAALLAAGFAGLAAAATGFVPLAFAPLVLGSILIGVTALRHARGGAAIEGASAALVFLLGAFAFMGGAAQFLLFFAGAILGVGLALARGSRAPVEEARDLRRFAGIAR